MLAVTAKIIPPHLPHLLFRKRLVEQVDRNKKLTLILGPAAQGKSALALSCTTASSKPSAWINLGPEDSDPVNLFILLVHSLQRALPDFDLAPVLQYPAVSLGPREPVFLYREWILALLERITAPVEIVLDGLDRLWAEAPSHEFLRVFLDYLPPHLHLFMSSRQMPPLRIEGLQMHQDINVLTSQELAFTLKETREFFREVRGLSVTSALTKRLHQLTEGWVGGLVLLSQTLEQIPEVLIEKYLTEGLERFKSNIYRYFTEQIFVTLPDETREFLLRSSVLEVIDPDFAQEFLGLTDARQMIEDLARRNLFIQPFYDPKKKCMYRYHQLFRDFLANKFITTFAPAKRRGVFLEAAELFQKRGELLEAVNYYLQAQSYSQAAALLEKTGLDLLALGQTGDLERAIEAFPKDLIEERPWLLMFDYICRRFKGSADVFQRLPKAYGMFEQQGDVRGILVSLAYLTEAAICVGSFGDDFHPLLSRAEELLDSLPVDAFPQEKATLCSQIGLVTVQYGDARRALRHCSNAYILARDLGDVPLQINALCNAYYAFTTLGEYPSAQEWWEKAEALVKKCTYPDLLTRHLILSTCFFYFQGKLEQAKEYCRAALQQIQEHGLVHFYNPALVYDLQIKYLEENFSDCEDLARILLQQFCRPSDNPLLRAINFHVIGIFYYRKGDYLLARKYIELSRSALPAINWINLSRLLSGLIACHLGEATSREEQALHKALDFFSQHGHRNFEMECHLAMALQKLELGRPREAAVSLQTGCRIAQERSYYHFFYLGFPDLVKLGRFALEQELTGCWDYFSELFVLPRFARHFGPELARLSQHPNARVARKAREIRAAIHRGSLPRLRFQTLGGFRLWRQGEIVAGRELESQPFLLLKAILSRSPAGVSKEELMEDLWPEAHPEVAAKNFKLNLHRLRKALEPGLDKTLGSSYIYLRGNILSLAPELCSVDAEQFVSFCETGEKKEREGDLGAALSFHIKAVELYGGDFLTDEPYAPWAGPKRERLRRKFVEVLMKSSSIHERQGSLKKATDYCKRAIEADPLLEEAYQKLMLLYFRRGMRSAALRAFDDCRKTLQSELQAEPDKLTQSIYQKILDHP